MKRVIDRVWRCIVDGRPDLVECTAEQWPYVRDAILERIHDYAVDPYTKGGAQALRRLADVHNPRPAGPLPKLPDDAVP